MICGECGYRNEAGVTLCASCNAYLGWARPSAPAEPAAEPVAPAAVTEPLGEPVPAAQAQAAQGASPVPPGRPVPPQAAAERPPPPEEEPPIRPGDLVCGRCGAGNDRSRRFCRKCANPLIQAGTGAAPPRRRGRERSRDLAAVGTRRGAAGAGQGATRLLRAVPLLALVAIAVLLLGPLRQAAIDRVNRSWPAIRPERPVRVAATSSAPGHGAEAAADLLKSTWWAEGAGGDGRGQRLVLTFAQPYDLTGVGITAGAGTGAATYLNQPRPARIRLLLPGASKDLELRDQPGLFQRFDLDARQVTSVAIQILSVYPSAGNRHHDCAITEVELFARGCRICRR